MLNLPELFGTRLREKVLPLITRRSFENGKVLLASNNRMFTSGFFPQGKNIYQLQDIA
jgi:hypothetical protein